VQLPDEEWGFPFPQIEPEYRIVAHLYCYFDESGKHHDHRYVTFSGFASTFETWRAFQPRWTYWLRHYGIPVFHAAEALRYSQPYGKMAAAKNATERAQDILPFIREIAFGLELGIYHGVDVAAYRQFGNKLQRELGIHDPHYFAFVKTVQTITEHFEIPKHFEIGLILHNEEEKAIECYKFLNKMKLGYPEARRITSICFMEDLNCPQLQASDLFAYITRREAEKRLLGIDYEYSDLFEAFRQISPDTQRHLHFAGGFYDAAALERQLSKSGGGRKERRRV
jgi:hypothetical protein